MADDSFPRVIRTVDLPKHGLRAGDLGMRVDRHVVAGMEEGWSVEFFDMAGNTVAVVTEPASRFRLPTAADRPSRAFPRGRVTAPRR